MDLQFDNTKIKRKTPIKRNHKFFGKDDYILETEFAKHGSFDLAYKLAVYFTHNSKGFRLAAIKSPGKKHNSFHASCQRRTSGSRPLVKQWESGGRAVVERYPSLG